MFETIFLPSKHEKKLRKNFEVRREKIIIMPCASKETLGKEPLYRVLKKHTANNQALSCALDLEYGKVKFKFCKRPRMGETVIMKVVDLEKLWNSVADNYFIWIRLGLQTSNLHSV